MYNMKFKGTHYEIGYKWGSDLKSRDVYLLDTVPFPITEDRLHFSKLCTPVYEKFFPEVLDEIKGIADGQGIADTRIKAVLLSMYSIMPGINCSCFVAKYDNSLIIGRNSDFLTCIEKFYMNTVYSLGGGSYSFNANTTAFVEMEDGINEHGFALGLTAVGAKAIKPGIDSGMLLRMGLEKCKTLDEFVDILNTVPRACSQTFVVADAKGNGALLECSSEKINLIKLDDKLHYGCSTNMFNTPEMAGSNNLPPDTWQAEERYETMQNYFQKNIADFTLENAKELLSGKYGFICQYDRKTGKDTVWSVIYDTINHEIYRVEGNPARKPFIKDEWIFSY